MDRLRGLGKIDILAWKRGQADARQVGDTRVRGLLMGPSTLAVQQLYREAGMAIADDYTDLPDHVGLMQQVTRWAFGPNLLPAGIP